MPEPIKLVAEPAGLPVLVTSPVDVGRLLRELESLNETLLQKGLRGHGPDSPIRLPTISRLLDKTVRLNKLDLLQPNDRQSLQQFLTGIKARAPVLHISFSADPSPGFVEKLMTWLRLEIHPQLLLTVGLQPTIGAGCIVRTTNKQFDLSLRRDFLNQRQLLLNRLAATTAKSQGTP